jgi:hypothetical protein
MKISSIVLLFALAVNAYAQSGNSTANWGPASPVPQDTPYSVVEKDANSRVWERTTYEKGPLGKFVPFVQRYTELASGLHYWSNGQWLDSEETIEIQPQGGAAAVRGQSQVYFPSDIYDGEIRQVTLTGQVLRSRPLGLSYDDGNKTVLIAELKHSIGQLLGSNQVIYPDAFTDFKADLLYTYTKHGFEQDIVLRDAPPVPGAYGLTPATSRLQVLTEFFAPPNPKVRQSTLPTQAGVSLPDQALDFSDMKMIRGRAFLLGAESETRPIFVGKQWLQLEGRQFLVEEVPIGAIASGLSALPSVAQDSRSQKTVHTASHHLNLPSQRMAKNGDSKKMLLAQSPLPSTGVVLDYQTVSGTLTNFTFQGDTTYFISGAVDLEGTNIFEGGAVIKYTNSSLAGVSFGYVAPIFQTGPYRPTIFTSMDDNSVGEAITGSTGNPTNTGATFLKMSFAGNPDVTAFRNLRFSYANYAIDYNSLGGPGPVEDCQFINCACAFFVEGGANAIKLYNDLFSQCDFALNVNLPVVAVNVTADQVGIFDDTGGPIPCLTNCIFTAVADPYSGANLDHCLIVGSGSGVYQTIGAGSYYLSINSTNRNSGASNIDPSLLIDLHQKTTYPPIACSNVTISTNLTLGPQALRDTNTSPDLGYHYNPIDYLVDYFWVTNATLTIANGAVVAGYNDSDLLITDGSSIVSVGSPLQPNWFTRYSAVQEQPIALGGGVIPGNTTMVNSYHATNAPSGYFRFTKFSCPAGGGYHLAHTSPTGSYSNLLVQNCEFWSGKNDFGGYSNVQATLENNLFARSALNAFGASYTNNYLSFSNNLFWNGSFSIRPLGSSNYWAFFNNSFDHITISFGANPQNVVNGYNAYIGDTNVTKRLNPVGGTDVIASNITYQTGPLGDFYQPTNTFLSNIGSVTADLAGLAYFTVTTNQVPETNSLVDIGYHYMTLDNTGTPVDSDADGVPDWIDADSSDPTIGALTITIDSPTNGFTFN